MPRPDPRCPRCARRYSWGTTVCPVCHIGLDLDDDAAHDAPEVGIFETGDRMSAEIVVSLLVAREVRCVLRGNGDVAHFGLGSAGWWRVLVRANDETRAQAILDAEIGRGEGE